ncbi:hypothetical protein SDJN03_16643, partial [Cucurbita argyrosperma subsp. sororia]
MHKSLNEGGKGYAIEKDPGQSLALSDSSSDHHRPDVQCLKPRLLWSTRASVINVSFHHVVQQHLLCNVAISVHIPSIFVTLVYLLQ